MTDRYRVRLLDGPVMEFCAASWLEAADLAATFGLVHGLRVVMLRWLGEDIETKDNGK